MLSVISEKVLIFHADEHFNLIAKNFDLSVKSLIDVIKTSCSEKGSGREHLTLKS